MATYKPKIKLDTAGNTEEIQLPISAVKDLDETLGEKANSADLATVATSGSYNDLSNKPTIPTVNNGTLTVTQNGTSKGTFTANQSGNTTIALTDTNTTYTFASGDSNGTIKVTPSGGTAQNVAVTGLGSAAYTASTAYATSAQGTKADNAVPNTRKVNGKALSADITLSASDVGALSSSTAYVSSVNGSSGAITNVAKTNASNTFSGNQSITGNLTLGGNLTVNGTTTTVNSTTLAVADKLIEVASGNTAALTTPAGLVAPKYDGTNSGAMVFDASGTAYVGDVVLDSSGNITVASSALQPLATRSEASALTNGNLLKWDSTNTKLVDSGLSASSVAKTSDIPTVNNGTLTIQKNGTSVATFSANQSGSATANITVPTKVSELTNDSGYTTNTGTITGIKMNGASKGTSGVVDLGTVITAHQDISGKLNLSGGTMTGQLKWNGLDSLPQNSSPKYFVTIDGFADGGATNWCSLATAKSVLGVPSTYAGSSSAGGSATSAVKLDTTTAGNATQPVYFSGGKPVATTYTLGASVPSGAKFTDTDTGATSVEVSGSGNAVTTASYDSSTRKLTLTKGTTFLTSHQSLSNYVTLDGAQTISGVKTFSASNNFTNETKFTNASYAPTFTDIASGLGKSSCFTRGALMQTITGQIIAPNAAVTDTTRAYNTEVGKIKFQRITGTSSGQPTLADMASIDSTGIKEGSSYLKDKYVTTNTDQISIAGDKTFVDDIYFDSQIIVEDLNQNYMFKVTPSAIDIDADDTEGYPIRIRNNAGTAGQVLTSNGDGATPAWRTITATSPIYTSTTIDAASLGQGIYFWKLSPATTYTVKWKYGSTYYSGTFTSPSGDYTMATVTVSYEWTIFVEYLLKQFNTGCGYSKICYCGYGTRDMVQTIEYNNYVLSFEGTEGQTIIGADEWGHLDIVMGYTLDYESDTGRYQASISNGSTTLVTTTAGYGTYLPVHYIVDKAYTGGVTVTDFKSTGTSTVGERTVATKDVDLTITESSGESSVYVFVVLNGVVSDYPATTRG